MSTSPNQNENYKIFVSFRNLKFSVCVKLSLQTSAFIDHCISVYKRLTDDPTDLRGKDFVIRIGEDYYLDPSYTVENILSELIRYHASSQTLIPVDIPKQSLSRPHVNVNERQDLVTIVERPRSTKGPYSPNRSALILGSTLSKYSPSEQRTRIELAAAYRLFHLFGWTDLIYNHLTAAVPEEDGHFLINPFGLLFNEITASSLIKVDLNGNIIDPGNTTFQINKPGFLLHSCIHKARNDIKSVMHCHSTAGVAVACYKDGLLPLSQNAHIIYSTISYHNYEGIVITTDEQKHIVADLGPKNKILILRNHGLVTCGDSIAEAFFYMYKHDLLPLPFVRC